MTKPTIYTKPALITKLKEISAIGFIPSARKGNHGGIGNTLEDLLGIEENNLPIPNAAEWELKAQRLNSTSLTTLFHMEPSPRAIRFVPQVLLPLYGWAHQEDDKKYPKGEKSFRQTIHGNSRSDRGFKVVVNRKEKKILISFDSKSINSKHKDWLKFVKKNVGLDELNPQPYWGFDDLEHKAGTKLLNTFYVQAEVEIKRKKEFYHYTKVMMLQKFSFKGFLKALDEGKILVDFDARTGHNHGTKFRMRQDCWPMLYEKSTIII
ncbi:MvaI/BcnI restriction endonuclease family protein [Patescibacteria group bacterium]|nr:MvaI/BcnI restriction endonuclease family protein [Candidatus Falkowbacteria bacterium]MBU3906429.1 MvaI/BcnI restriction endonuclease family protein [Patescibacteria group bacterium]MCG2697836.1 MvaI/BcnI family restriction endonuclease [Candidatus Parcubacteria bacterium]MBU4015484.1 MvaI/BcnI restriction endonuclease family protein [Patescibacteria group bacterium]MBU4026391.1 MvaI/BcnI restriction endonuclease family protein [Patescibacteria group bacterium]